MTDRQRTVAVTVYSDYICPFCYIGHLRLERLRRQHELHVDWRFFEIHPNNPASGMPLSELGYPPDHWAMLTRNLERMANEEGVRLATRTFTTNSHRALLLAEASKAQPESFAELNRRLYEAYFLEQQNLGDEQVLRRLAEASGLCSALVEAAWNEPRYEEVLRANLVAAATIGISGTPSYVIGDRVMVGAVPVDVLTQAVEDADDTG